MTAILTAAAAALLGGIAPGRSEKKKRRNTIILQRYFGLAGMIRRSMAEAGAPTPEEEADYREAVAKARTKEELPEPLEPLTRESVRQIIAQAVDLIDRNCETYLALQRIFADLEAALPAAAPQLEAKLLAANLIDDELSVEGAIGLMELAGLHDGSIKVFDLGGARFVGRERDEEALRDLTSRAIKECSHNGAVNLPALMTVAGFRTDVPTVVGAALAALDAEGGVIRLIQSENFDGPAWFMFGLKSRNRLLSCGARVFAVFQSVDEGAFSEALARYFRKGDSKRKETVPAVGKDGKPRKRQRTPSAQTLIPPADVIAAALAVANLASRDGKTLKSLVNGQQNAVDSPGDMELRIVRFLGESATGTRREKEIENAVVGQVSEKFSFAMALNYSPLILRQRSPGKRRKEPTYERGVYRLTGTGLMA